MQSLVVIKMIPPLLPAEIRRRPRTSSSMALENSASDNARGNALDSSPVWGYILDGLVDVDNLKMALEKVIRHFPILSARMDRSATGLVLRTQEVELFSW